MSSAGAAGASGGNLAQRSNVSREFWIWHSICKVYESDEDRNTALQLSRLIDDTRRGRIDAVIIGILVTLMSIGVCMVLLLLLFPFISERDDGSWLLGMVLVGLVLGIGSNLLYWHYAVYRPADRRLAEFEAKLTPEQHFGQEVRKIHARVGPKI